MAPGLHSDWFATYHSVSKPEGSHLKRACCLIVALLPCLAYAQVRVVPSMAEQEEAAKPKPLVLTPKAPFDEAEARSALEPGTATIQGEVCSKYDGLVYPAENTAVWLFPRTAYLEEWVKLWKSRNKKKQYEGLPEQVWNIRIDSQTDGQGRFRITEVKPGKYLIIVTHSFNQGMERDVYTGSGYGNYGGRIDYYETQQYSIGREKSLFKQVDVEAEGKVYDVDVKGGNWGGLIPALTGC